MRIVTTAYWKLIAFGVFVGLGSLDAWCQTAPDPLTSIAIDPTLFRDGAITRFSGTHDNWNYVCDEVAKMKKRFCSLRSTLKDSQGRIVAALTISTGEDGRPAALLRMAANEFDETGIEIAALAPPAAAKPTGNKDGAKSKPKPPAATKLYPAACAADICQMVWTLPVDHIEALNAGSGLRMRYFRSMPRQSSLATALKSAPPAAIEVLIPAAGFSAAVDASTKPLN